MTALALRLPDATGVLQIGGSIQSGVGGLSQLLGGLGGGGGGGGGADSPLAALTTALGQLPGQLNIDTRALGTDLPAALATMGHALAPSALDFIASLQQDFDGARRLLADSALARAVADGQQLQDVALAAVHDALAAFDARRAELLGRLFPSADLAVLSDTLALLQHLGTDYAAHRAELAPFIARYLVGAPADLLAAAQAPVQQALQVLDAWAPAQVAGLVDAPLATLNTALRALLQQIDSLDVADAAAYDALDGLTQAVQAALGPLCTALAAVYAQATAAVQASAWDAALAASTQALNAIPLDAVPVPADAVQALATVLEGLLSRLEAQFTPDDVAARVRALAAALHEVFDASPLGQVRGVIRDFLGRIQAGLDAIPTDKISGTVHAVLQQVGDQVQQLGLAEAGDRIEAAFQSAEAFITSHLDAALGQQVAGALAALLDKLDALPIHTLVDNIGQLIAQLQQAVAQLQAALDQAMAQLGQVADQLDQLSFQPVGDAVVGEIDALRTKLAAINPNALSDIEKGALQAALAVVRAVDLEGVVQREVKQGFGVARDTALQGLDQVTAVLQGLRQQLDAFSPQHLVQDLVAVLHEAQQTVATLDGRAVMRPLYGQVNQLAGLLGQARPGALLGPLQAPYQAVADGVAQLDPTQLVAPLNGLYAQIDGLIDKVDVQPLLAELDRRQTALLTDVRTALLTGLAGLQLPAPLDTLFAQIRPVLEGMTEALLADPSVELRRVGLDLSTRLQPSDLFKPLDAAFGQFIDLLRGVPAADLEAAFNALRSGLGTGLDVTDPTRLRTALRAGRGTLADLSPQALLGTALQLPAWQARFTLRVADAPLALQVRASASATRLGTLGDLLGGAAGPVAPLLTAHAALDAALAQRLRSLDTSGAQAAHARVAGQLRRLLPPFLLQAQPLSRADILVGLQAMRPSAQAGTLDALFQRFQARLRAMQDVLDPAFAEFFNTLREPLQMLSPLAIRDDVAALYTTLRAKVRVIDPTALAADLHASVYDPVVAALGAIDPARLGQRLDAAYQRVLQALTQQVTALLDTVAGALDHQLQRLKDAVATIAGQIEAALTQAAQVFDGLVQGLEHLVFVDILERLKRLVRTLGVSFDREVDRVVSAFDQMLGAIPLGGGSGGAQQGVTL